MFNGNDSVTNILFVRTGIAASSPSENEAPSWPPPRGEEIALILYVMAELKLNGISIGNFTATLCPAGTVKYCCGKIFLNQPSTGLLVAASNNSNCDVPVISLAVKFTIFAENSIRSPSLKKRGAFGWTINCFCVTVVLLLTALASSFVCASTCSFHCVSASGMVKENSTLPAASVFKCGKKKAVSLKFLRSFTSAELSDTFDCWILSGCLSAGAFLFNLLSKLPFLLRLSVWTFALISLLLSISISASDVGAAANCMEDIPLKTILPP